MLDNLIQKLKSQGEQILKKFTDELKTLYSSRANTILVENILVSYYGGKVPLKQVAQINIPQNNLIVIQPWDRSALINIEAAIRESELNLNPSNDGQAVHLALPPLTEERRKELTKMVHSMAETCRIALRNERRKIWEEIQNLVKAGKATEDDKYQSQDELNKIIEEFNKQIEKIAAGKENEIMRG